MDNCSVCNNETDKTLESNGNVLVICDECFETMFAGSKVYTRGVTGHSYAVLGKRFMIKYEDTSGDETTRPIHMRYLAKKPNGDPWYIKSYCLLKDEMRTFNVDGIKEFYEWDEGLEQWCIDDIGGTLSLLESDLIYKADFGDDLDFGDIEDDCEHEYDYGDFDYEDVDDSDDDGMDLEAIVSSTLAMVKDSLGEVMRGGYLDKKLDQVKEDMLYND